MGFNSGFKGLNTLCEQNVGFLNAKPYPMKRNRWVLKG